MVGRGLPETVLEADDEVAGPDAGVRLGQEGMRSMSGGSGRWGIGRIGGR